MGNLPHSSHFFLIRGPSPNSICCFWGAYRSASLLFEGMTDGNEKTRFLPSIAAALAAVQQQGDEITTVAIANLFDSIILIFDYLGPVLHFAKHDMHSKCESLKKASGQYATLRDLVDAGVVRFSCHGHAMINGVDQWMYCSCVHAQAHHQSSSSPFTFQTTKQVPSLRRIRVHVTFIASMPSWLSCVCF